MRTFNNFELKRVSFNLPLPLYTRVKTYSDNQGVPFTQGVTLLLNKALDSDDIMKTMPDILKSLIEFKESTNKTE